MRVWSHAVMLLLGITLAVGFYEGRRFVTNTMRALRIGYGSPGLAARLDPDAIDERTDDGRRGRSGSRKSARANAAEDGDDDRATMRDRVRSRAGIEGERAPSAAVARTPREPGSEVDRELAVPADPLQGDTGEPQQ